LGDSCDALVAASGPTPLSFKGPLCQRANLTGDWCGLRSGWAENGIAVDADTTQWYLGVASGGLDREFRYAGRGDYLMNIDMGKLAGREGLFVKLRAEHRFGESLAGATGGFLPPNVAADLPVLNSESLYLTNVLFTQALSESFALFAGKLDTLDGDVNAFAHGRGKSQFSNVGFVVNPALLRIVPYSTLGAGFVVLREGQPLLTFSLLNAVDTTRTSGFDELFAEGVVITSELRVPTQLLGKPGHQLFGGGWSSREFVSLGQDPRIVLPDVPIARQSGSWALYWNFDQYLVTDRATNTRGWGVFGRAGITDDAVNPIASFLSFGVGGNSPLRGRPADTFGIGWFRNETSEEIGPLLQAGLGPIGDGQAIELFYNIAVTPWFRLTPDLQWIAPARSQIDDALVLGLRGQVIF
jgi:porin